MISGLGLGSGRAVLYVAELVGAAAVPWTIAMVLTWFSKRRAGVFYGLAIVAVSLALMLDGAKYNKPGFKGSGNDVEVATGFVGPDTDKAVKTVVTSLLLLT